MSGFDDVRVEHDAADEAVLEEDVVDTAQPSGLPAGVSKVGDHFEIGLGHPVVLRFKTGESVREERFEYLRARRLTGADLRAMMTSDRKDGAMLLLERILIDIPDSRRGQVIDRMDASDLGRALELVAFLGPKSPTTGS